MNTAEILNFHREEQHVKADLKNGFAQISFDLIHCLAKRNLTAYQTRLLWVVIEACYGLHKYDAKHISLNTLEEATGLDRRHVIRAKKELIEMRILFSVDGALGINRNTWEWQEPMKGVPTKAPGVPVEEPQGVPDQAPDGVPVQAQTGVPVEEPYIDINEDSNKRDKDSIPDSGKSGAQKSASAFPDYESNDEAWYGTWRKDRNGKKYRNQITGKHLEAFKQLWDAYDWKKGRPEAIDAFLEIPNRTIGLLNRMIHAAKLEAKRRPAILASGGTPKWLQGWINSGRYEDEGEPFQFTPEQQQFIDLFNEHVANGSMQRMPAVHDFSIERAIRIQAQLIERPALEWWAGFFSYINDKCNTLPEKVTFNWLLKSENFLNVKGGHHE